MPRKKMRGFFNERKIRFHETTCFIECYENVKMFKIA